MDGTGFDRPLTVKTSMRHRPAVAWELVSGLKSRVDSVELEKTFFFFN